MAAMEDEAESHRMPLLSHLAELRTRLIYSFVAFILVFFVCFHFAQDIYAFLVRPLAAQFEGHNVRLIYTALHEAFFTYVKIAFFAAAFFSFPIMSAQIWLFVAPGLYKHEKGAFLPFLIATPIMFLAGASFVYFLVMPVAWEFFLSFQQPGGEGEPVIEVLPKVGEYLSLSMRLIFAFGIGFEVPVLLTLLGRVGIASAAGLASKRRYAIVASFVAAAVLTPPDVISQLALAIPIILLYEVSIVLVRIFEKKRAAAAPEEDGDGDDEPPSRGPDPDDDGLAEETDFNMAR